jgi:hypothetical protein
VPFPWSTKNDAEFGKFAASELVIMFTGHDRHT